jgi:hypothetical protein
LSFHDNKSVWAKSVLGNKCVIHLAVKWIKQVLAATLLHRVRNEAEQWRVGCCLFAFNLNLALLDDAIGNIFFLSRYFWANAAPFQFALVVTLAPRPTMASALFFPEE